MISFYVTVHRLSKNRQKNYFESTEISADFARGTQKYF